MSNYITIRPPLADTFPVPADDLLLKQKPENLVKVTFQVGNEKPERMWVVLKDIANSESWTGEIDNDATQPLTKEELPVGMTVEFHPRDIINVWIDAAE